MAKPIDWLPLVPEALEQLRTVNSRVVDRATLERIFKVHRRTAIRLMHQFGGEQVGKTFLIDREHLIQSLERLQSEQTQQGPRSRTGSQIRRLHPEAEGFHFPDVRTPERRTVARLPRSIEISSGQITIKAADLPELCAQLWIFLETCNEDREAVESKLENRK